MLEPVVTTGLPIADAARVLGERPGTLRRWVREGCPTINPGRRGRGHAVLVDPGQIQRWRDGGREALLLEFASAMPGLLATATMQSWRQAEGIDKRRLAGILAAAWYASTTAALDHLRALCPGVPDVSSLPPEIEHLRKIAR